MTKQNSEATVEATKKAAATLANLFELWSSTIYTTMHNINSANQASFQSQIEAVLRSNKEFIAFNVFSKKRNEKSKQVAVSFTPYADGPIFESIDPTEAKNEILKLNQSLADLKGQPKTEPEITNLKKQIGLDAVQIKIEFQIKNSETKYIAFLVVSAERIRNLTEQKSNEESFIVTQDGTIFMSALRSKRKLGSPYGSKALTQVASQSVPTALTSTTDSSGIPQLEAAMLVPKTELAFVFQKNAGKEYEQIRWQIRQIAIVS